MQEKRQETVSALAMTDLSECGMTLNTAARYAGLAQLGEHLPYKQRVIGPSPILSTICGR